MDRTSGTPISLRIAVLVLFTQAAAMAVVAGFFGYELATQPPTSMSSAASLIVFTAGLAALMAGLGWALYQRKALARGPAIVTELLVIPVGWYMVQGGAVLFGIPVAALGLLGAGALFAPATREALGIR